MQIATAYEKKKKRNRQTVCESVVAVKGERMCVSDDLIIRVD